MEDVRWDNTVGWPTCKYMHILVSLGYYRVPGLTLRIFKLDREVEGLGVCNNNMCASEAIATERCLIRAQMRHSAERQEQIKAKTNCIHWQATKQHHALVPNSLVRTVGWLIRQ